MTFVGKLLVVMIFLMSLCLMAFAGAVVAVQTNWKKTHDDLKTQLETEKKQRQDLVEEKTKLETDLTQRVVAAEAERDRFRADNTNMKDQLDARNQQIERITAELNDQRTLADIAGEEARMRRSEALTQRTVNEELHKMLDTSTAEIRKLKDEVFSRSRDYDALTLRYEGVLEELARTRQFLALNDLEMPKDFRGADVPLPPPPTVEGLVTDARKSTKQRGLEFVEISIGSDDGLLEGHQLFVYRPGAQNDGRPMYLGKIQVVLLTPDKAVGRVIDKAKNGVIEVGDHVTTKL